MTSCVTRIQLRRTKGWRKPDNTVVVARPSKWGNPYRPAPAIDSPYLRAPAITAADAVHLFRQRWTNALANWPDSTRASLDELRGKNLACWCPLDQPCHADVLLELANAPLGCEAV